MEDNLAVFRSYLYSSITYTRRRKEKRQLDEKAKKRKILNEVEKQKSEDDGKHKKILENLRKLLKERRTKECSKKVTNAILKELKKILVNGIWEKKI